MRSSMPTSSSVRRWALSLAIATLIVADPVAAAAQNAVAASQPTSAALRGPAPTRAELEALAASAEQAAQSASEAKVKERKLAEAVSLRERLRDGDFQTGDRIVVEVLGAEAPIVDTATVRSARMLQLTGMSPISLHGILRSELEAHLTSEIGRYIREPKVTASSLIQIVVTGKVGKPGFLWVPSDILLSDAIMMVGLSSGSDINKTTLKRAGKELLPKERVQVALRQGQTIDQLSVRAGDEVNVGAESVRDYKQYLFALTSVVTLFWTIRRIGGGRGGY